MGGNWCVGVLFFSPVSISTFFSHFELFLYFRLLPRPFFSCLRPENKERSDLSVRPPPIFADRFLSILSTAETFGLDHVARSQFRGLFDIESGLRDRVYGPSFVFDLLPFRVLVWCHRLGNCAFARVPGFKASFPNVFYLSDRRYIPSRISRACRHTLCCPFLFLPCEVSTLSGDQSLPSGNHGLLKNDPLSC